MKIPITYLAAEPIAPARALLAVRTREVSATHLNPDADRSADGAGLPPAEPVSGPKSLGEGEQSRNSNGGDASTTNPRPILEFIASDETLDRYREIIVASGWRLESYRRNPVFQNAHQYSDVIFTLGRALLTEVREGRLYQCIEFATDVNPLAKVAHGLYQGGFLNAVSVGFIPLRWVEGDLEAGFGRKYLEQELLEVSAVAIPANPNALQLGLRAGAVETSDLRDLANLLAHALAAPTPAINSPPINYPLSGCSPPAASTIDTRALDPGSNEAQWLQLARELEAILRRA